MKTFAAIFLLLACASVAKPDPQIYGRHAILFDAQTGVVLYKKNDTVRTPVASTQKLLTSFIVARDGDLDRKVTVAPIDTKTDPTKLGFKAGDEYTRHELLRVLLVKSANDVARALARDNAGSIELFADKMNAEMQRLGGKSSHFINPNGLPVEDQYSTARDMACVARAAYQNPVLREIMCTKSFEFHFADGKKRELTNTNRVLRTYSFCNGMKTGYTDLAGHCLIASGSHEGRDMIAVVLGSNKAHVWDDAASLLEYGLGIRRQEFAAVTPKAEKKPAH